MSQQIKALSDEADFGDIEKAAILKTSFVVQNSGKDKVFIMRADAPKKLLVQTSKKIVPPGDSASIQVTYTPDAQGKFNEEFSVFTSAANEPLTFTIKGKLLILETNNLNACVTFSPKYGKNEDQAIIPVISERTYNFTDASSGTKLKEVMLVITDLKTGTPQTFSSSAGTIKLNLPVGRYLFEAIASGYSPQVTEQYVGFSSGTHTFVLPPLKQVEPTPTIPLITILPDEADDSELSERLYRPNNIVFLIDISRSMKEEDRLPLLQKCIGRLLEPIRAIDTITVITYADGAQVLVQPQSGEAKKLIKSKVDSLKAKGFTAGSKGIQLAYEYATKHHLKQGNNLIIIASDGAFKLMNEDKEMISSAATNNEKQILLSAVALGTNRNTLNMLKGIAEIGQGSFLHLQNAETDTDALINEIKLRSQRR